MPSKEELPRTEREARKQGPPSEQPGGRRAPLVAALHDAKRKRRSRRPLKRLVAIVPVSDYRDVVG